MSKTKTEKYKDDLSGVGYICWLSCGSFQLWVRVTLSCGLGARALGWVYLAAYVLGHLTRGSSQTHVNKE